MPESLRTEPLTRRVYRILPDGTRELLHIGEPPEPPERPVRVHGRHKKSNVVREVMGLMLFTGGLLILVTVLGVLLVEVMLKRL